MNKEQFTNYLQNPENLNANSLPGLREIVNRFPYCQSAHILLTLNLLKEENVAYNASLKLTAVYAGNRRLLKQKVDELERKVAEADPPGAQKETAIDAPAIEEPDKKPAVAEARIAKTKQELLDEFIRKQPSISRGRETFFNASDASRRSIVDQENIVSETLAKVYFDQHYYDKAINIYQKLSLKYPEKSIYFAALIEKAKNELKP